jgi:rRNA maturation protein Nop10
VVRPGDRAYYTHPPRLSIDQQYERWIMTIFTLISEAVKEA